MTDKEKSGKIGKAKKTICRIFFILMFAELILAFTVVIKNAAEIAACKKETSATPMYASPYEGVFKNFYDYEVTYMYVYDGSSRIGTDYASEDEVTKMQDSKITVWINESNPEQSYFNPKEEIRRLCDIIMVVCAFGIICLTSAGRKTTESVRETDKENIQTKNIQKEN